MNMIYLALGESGRLIPPSDRRWKHVRTILRKSGGESLFAGCEDGTTGAATIIRMDETGLVLDYKPSSRAAPLHHVRVLMGFPRPIQAGRILKDLTSLGVGSIWFTLSELGEKSYAESNFFRNSEFMQHLVEGVEQSGNPLIPEIRTFWSLAKALKELDSRSGDEPIGAESRILLHPGEGSPLISRLPDLHGSATMAIGSERGWTEAEIGVFAEHKFRIAQLGGRILKTETAALAAVSILLARMGFM